MKKILPLLFVILAAVLPACQKKTETPPAPKAGGAVKANPVANPVENYAKGMKGYEGRAEGAQAEEDLGDIRTAIQTYQMDNGRYPASLAAVKPYIRAGIDINRFNYNPADGSVSLK